LKVAFLGPEGTFSEEALFAAVDRATIEPAPMPTIYDCVIAVQEGQVDRALVPIENSLEGSVSATLDALVFEADAVVIAGELIHPVRHSLIARRRLALEEITRVVSHPQASAQCARFLRDRLPSAEVAGAASTADAVRIVAATDAPWAAVGTRLSAEIYGCEVLRDGIEDDPDNETRFVWLARAEATQSLFQPVDPQADQRKLFKTSIVFWGLPDTPGSLVRVLQEFAERGVNLTKIESRPRKQGLGSYIFLADLEGGESTTQVRAALDAVGDITSSLRVLGSYPAARRT
jgi:prephenate dehydratase